jgi:hypothetical protein
MIMKKTFWIFATAMLLFAILTGCVEPPASTGSAPSGTTPTVAPTQQPTVPTTQPTQPPTTPPTEAPAPEVGTAAHYIQVIYAQQIQRYRTAIAQQWDKDTYSANGLSVLPLQYDQGQLPDNIGVGFVDLDQDGSWELILGAVWNAEADPLVFEIWTLVDGAPKMVAQSDEENRYYLQYSPDDETWYVALEVTRSETHYGVHYLLFQGDRFEVIQAIIYDAATNPTAPWFMSYDMDMDTTNDEDLDESTATFMIDFNRKLYIAAEYTPYGLLP